MMTRFAACLAIGAPLAAGPVRAQETAALDRVRPARWAESMAVEGVPNCHKVSDALYRSAQPNAEGMQNLKRMGIATVVNLRSFHSDRKEIGETGLADAGR